MTQNNDSTEISMLGFLAGVRNYLDDLIESNRKLLSALHEYQDLLVDGSTAPIEKATPKLDRFTGEIRIIDEKRRAFVDSFFVLKGWDGPRNFSAISERVRIAGVSDEEAAEFERAAVARMKLIEILAEVDAQNSLNMTLIGQSMSFAEVSLRALLGIDNNPATYGPTDPNEDGPSLLDQQA